jgi:hypothetical protein
VRDRERDASQPLTSPFPMTGHRVSISIDASQSRSHAKDRSARVRDAMARCPYTACPRTSCGDTPHRLSCPHTRCHLIYPPPRHASPPRPFSAAHHPGRRRRAFMRACCRPGALVSVAPALPSLGRGTPRPSHRGSPATPQASANGAAASHSSKRTAAVTAAST